MSILEVKQELSRMTARQRQEIQLYLLRLKRETPAWRKAMAKRRKDLATGHGVSLADLTKGLPKG